VFRWRYIRRIGFILFDFNDTQILADFGNLPFLNEDLGGGAVVRAGDLDACLVTLHLAEWLEGANRRSRGYTPIDQERAREMTE